MSALRVFVVCLLFVTLLSGCAFSRQVNVRSHPTGAQASLKGEPLGPTPTTARARTTGFIPLLTFHPQSVTFELDGYDRAVRRFDYEWSMRNLAVSVLTIIGLPGVFLWSKEPVDLWVVLTPESQ